MFLSPLALQAGSLRSSQTNMLFWEQFLIPLYLPLAACPSLVTRAVVWEAWKVASPTVEVVVLSVERDVWQMLETTLSLLWLESRPQGGLDTL